jgi:hypothetical protein
LTKPSGNTKSPNPEALFRIKNAFEDWKRSKGAARENSDRNQRHALTGRNDALNQLADYRTYQITHFTTEELAALAHVARERKQVPLPSPPSLGISKTVTICSQAGQKWV